MKKSGLAPVGMPRSMNTMNRFTACLCILLAAIPALAEEEKNKAPAHPFEVTFVNRLPAADIAPVYDPQLPGFSFDAQIATVKIRPLTDKPPAKLILVIRTTPGMQPMLEGFTLQAPDLHVTTGLKLPTEEIHHTAAPGKTELRKREYFDVKVVGKDVHVVFLPKAMELLTKECTITWVDWYRH